MSPRETTAFKELEHVHPTISRDHMLLSFTLIFEKTNYVPRLYSHLHYGPIDCIRQMCVMDIGRSYILRD